MDIINILLVVLMILVFFFIFPNIFQSGEAFVSPAVFDQMASRDPHDMYLTVGNEKYFPPYYPYPEMMWNNPTRWPYYYPYYYSYYYPMMRYKYRY